MLGSATLGVKRVHAIDCALPAGTDSPLGLKTSNLYEVAATKTTALSGNRKSLKYKTIPTVSLSATPYDGYIAGLVKEEGLPISGKLVRAHERDTGLVAGQAISQSNGYFKITGLDRDTTNYYVVAFNDTPGKDFNAIVYDRIDPISDPVYDLDIASMTILGNEPLAYWKSVTPFLKDGVYHDYGTLRQDVTLCSQNFSSVSQAWSDAPYSLRRMGRLFQQGCYLPIPDLLYNNLENGWTLEIFVKFSQASNNENLFEAISDYSAGATLASHANTIRVGRVGTSNDVIVEAYSGNTLLGSASSSGTSYLDPGFPTVVALVYSAEGTLKVYVKGDLAASMNVQLPDVSRQYCYIGKNSMSGSSQFTGVVSDVAVFVAALNPLQLATHCDYI